MNLRQSLLPFLTGGVISFAQNVHADIVSLDCKRDDVDTVVTLHIDTGAGFIQKNGWRFPLTVTPDEYIGKLDVVGDKDSSKVTGMEEIKVNRHTGAMTVTIHYFPTGIFTWNHMCEKRRKQAPKF